MQKINQKIQIKNRFVECSSYIVKNQTINLNDEDDAGKFKTIVPKEKISAPKKSNSSNEICVNYCSFCNLKSNEVYGIGELFGPYYKEAEDGDSDAEEIFVHEGCAVWTKDIYVFENKVYGLQESVNESKEYVA